MSAIGCRRSCAPRSWIWCNPEFIAPRPAPAGLFAQCVFRRKDVPQDIEAPGAEPRQGIGVGGDLLDLAVVEVGHAALRVAANADL